MRQTRPSNVERPPIPVTGGSWRTSADSPAWRGWIQRPRALHGYIAVVCISASLVALKAIEQSGSTPPEALAVLMMLTLIASLIKIEIPVGGNASTLTACHVIDLVALVMYGTHAAVVVSAWGAWTQCALRARVPNPPHQTAFSMASLAITLWSAGAVFSWMGGRPNGLSTAIQWEPVAAAATTSFVINSALVAVAVSLAAKQHFFTTWFDFFFSSWPSYVVGAVLAAAIVNGIQHRSYWLLPVLTGALALIHRNHKSIVERINDSMIDSLTGLYNQRFVATHAERELARARRSGESVAIAVVDVDDFKRINDRHGHAAGDAALRRVADALRQIVRAYDVCARYGGDEFVVVMTGCTATEALQLIQAAKRAIAADVPERAQFAGLPVIISAGVAVFPEDGDRFETLFAAADARMYRCKHAPEFLLKQREGRAGRTFVDAELRWGTGTSALSHRSSPGDHTRAQASGAPARARGCNAAFDDP